MSKIRQIRNQTSYNNGVLVGIFLTLCAVAAFVILVSASGGTIYIKW